MKRNVYEITHSKEGGKKEKNPPYFEKKNVRNILKTKSKRKSLQLFRISHYTESVSTTTIGRNDGILSIWNCPFNNIIEHSMCNPKESIYQALKMNEEKKSLNINESNVMNGKK